MDTEEIILEYVCPSMGCIMAAAMCAAPITDLRQALTVGTLGDLNPLPWVFMTGNCLGLIAYAYYTDDPFILAANLPGLLLSLWLNQGAIKLQYLELRTLSTSRANLGDGDSGPLIINDNNNSNSNNNNTMISGEEEENENERGILQDGEQQQQQQLMIPAEAMIFVSQEVSLYRILLVWSSILLWVGWISPLLATDKSSILATRLSSTTTAAEIVGVCSNLNLMFFYGAPLTSIFEVLQTRRSTSIHRPTMYMSLLNATFWTGYGFAQMDPFIIVPNGVGMILGTIQFLLCRIFPRGGEKDDRIPLPGESFEDDDDDDDDDGIMMMNTNGRSSTIAATDSDQDNNRGCNVELEDDDFELL